MDKKPHEFGKISEWDDYGELDVRKDVVVLTLVVRTERGPRRYAIGEIPTETWTSIKGVVVKELADTLEDGGSKVIKAGMNRLECRPAGELAVLWYALINPRSQDYIDAILPRWAAMFKYERRWLWNQASPFASNPAGWRRAIFSALADAA